MKAKILLLSIPVFFLIFSLNGYSQNNDWQNELKGAKSNMDYLMNSEEPNAITSQNVLTNNMALQANKRYLQKSSFIESLNYNETDVVYQRMEWEINPNILYIKGSITSYFTSQIESLSEIVFDLNDVMQVDSVIQNKQKINFTHKDNKLAINLLYPLQNKQLDSVQVFYQGEPKTTESGSVSSDRSFKKVFHDGVPTIFTRSHPYGAMDWWPCKQSLVDKIDSIDIIVTSPDSFRTASCGVLVSEIVENGKRKMHWKHRYPTATYMVGLAVSNYVVYSDWLELDDGRKIEIVNYVFPESLESAKTNTPVIIEIMKFYNQLIGEYPFANEKYGIAQIPGFIDMGCQTINFTVDFLYYTHSIGLAYQYFGDYIGSSSWHDVLVDESLAFYIGMLSYDSLRSELWPTWQEDFVNSIVSSPGGSVYAPDTSIARIKDQRLTYRKGPFLLRMLRGILGDDDFFKGMKSYFNDPELAYGFASVNQFVRHIEIAGDTSLTEFFDDWYYGEGYPIYSLAYTLMDDDSLKIELSQEPSHNSVDFFEMPVPVRVYNGDKTKYHDFKFTHTRNNQEFIVNIDFKLGGIEIDPDNWLISKTSEIIDKDPVEDCYVKLVDRATGQSLPNINLTYYGTTVRSTNKGFCPIKNFRNGTFSYSIQESARYFTEAGTINLNPGDTAIVALTRKTAAVQFLLQNESGGIANQKLIIDGKEYFSDEEGIIKVRNVDAREMCSYSFESPDYVSIVDSVYIEIDTLVNIMLLSTSVKDMEAGNFTIFPNPVDNELTIQTSDIQNTSVKISSLTGKLIYSSKITETEHHIDFTPYKSGVYIIRFTSNNLISTRKIIKL